MNKKIEERIATKILHDPNKLTEKEEKSMRKELNQNDQFKSNYYEFILEQQIVKAVRELKLDGCVIKGLYVRDFMPGFEEKGETESESEQSYELNDHKNKLIEILKIKHVSKDDLKQKVQEHKRKEQSKERSRFKKLKHVKNDDLENQTQRKTEKDKNVFKLVFF